MSLVLQLRSERAKLNDSIQALAKLESGSETLSAEQLAQFSKLELDFNALTEKIARAEQAERIAAASAVPVNELAKGRTNKPHGHISGTGPAEAQAFAWRRWSACWLQQVATNSKLLRWQSKAVSPLM